MVEPVDDGNGPEEQLPVAAAAAVLYGLLALAGYAWLWLRDRTGQIGASAVGDHGIWISAGIGLVVALAVAAALWALERYLDSVALLVARLRVLIGPMHDRQITVVAFCSAVGEEFFFRLAMQDALGLYWTAAIFAVLHLGPRGFRAMAVVALAIGLVFGWMMESGCGLLSVTLARAVLNDLTLRRMERR